MSPVRRHFWQVVARVNSSLQRPRKWSLNWFMPAGVNSTEGSQWGTSTSLGRRTQPLPSKNSRYFSRSSSDFIVFAAQCREDCSKRILHDIGPAGRREVAKLAAGVPGPFHIWTMTIGHSRLPAVAEAAIGETGG